MKMQRLLARLKKKARLEPVAFRDLQGWRDDDAKGAHVAFLESCRQISNSAVPLRKGLTPPEELTGVCRQAHQDQIHHPNKIIDARKYFESQFQPYLITPLSATRPTRSGFVTGYYEPEVAGSLVSTAEFTEPLMSLPVGHVILKGESGQQGLAPGLTTGLKSDSGAIRAYPDRAAITRGEMGKLSAPLVWVRDGIEAFMINVQGSARIRLKDGRVLRLKYAGRNGYPYSSIGRILVRQFNLSPSQVTMSFLKRWIRKAGQKSGQPGRLLMEENRSFIFFELDFAIREHAGPIGAAGVSLSPLRSLAIDRTVWPYGLPFWLDANLPWQSKKPTSFRRLMIAQDTGSAILGPARADIFFGSGPGAGSLAGAIRHDAHLHVFLPK